MTNVAAVSYCSGQGLEIVRVYSTRVRFCGPPAECHYLVHLWRNPYTHTRCHNHIGKLYGMGMYGITWMLFISLPGGVTCIIFVI